MNNLASSPATVKAPASSLTYEQAEQQFSRGQMSARDFRRYRFLWTWCAYRYSRTAQTRYYKRHGYKALMRRINWVRRVAGFGPIPVS